MKNALILGYGTVGKVTAQVLDISDWIDKEEENLSQEFLAYKYYIFCLPTPTIKGKQDISAIEEYLERLRSHSDKPTIVIRSTVLPGTIDMLIDKYGLRITYVPEFLTESSALFDMRKPELLVIGTREKFLRGVIKSLFWRIKPKYKIYCDPVTAEMIKYVMNSFFALKVILGNQFFDICQEVGGDYKKVKSALEHHKWGAKNGWDIFHSGFRGYKGSCLPKDIEAFVAKFNSPLLGEMQRINNELIK